MATINHWSIKIAAAIYDLICYIYDIFYFLCNIQLFENEDYEHIVNNIYIILGVIMAFVLAYSLLKAVINPDEFSKGESSFPKLVKNIVISLALIIVLPTVFSTVYSIQNSLLSYNVIPNLILGNSNGTDVSKSDGSSLNIGGVSGGRYIAYHTFSAFFFPREEYCESAENDNGDGDSISSCTNLIMNDGQLFTRGKTSLSSINEDVLAGDLSFKYYAEFSEAVRDRQLDFDFIGSVAAGLFIAYVLLNFCFDMALRVVKLAFYQIIAPIPIVCRIIPGGKLKDVFSKWVKQVISLFIEVFVRVGALSFGVYLISVVVDKFLNYSYNGLGWGTDLIIKALLIMAVVMFVKQIPKLIGDLFGLDTGGMKLGLMDKLAAGGGLAVGAALGSGVSMLGRNAVAMGKNIHDAKGGKKKAGALIRGLGSTTAGTLSGAGRGLWGARNAKNFGDMKKATNSAVTGATDARIKRSNYRAAHAGSNPLETGMNVAFGHVEDAIVGAGEYFGIGSLEGLKAEKEAASAMQGFYKEMAGFVEDDKMVEKYAGLYEAERKREISRTVSSFDNKGYMAAVEARVKAMSGDSRYKKLSQDELYSIAQSDVSKDQFTTTREMTAKEYSDALQARQETLEKLDNLKKIATIKAVNKKLSEGDSRFVSVANKANTFQKQNASYDFVKNMHSIEGVAWDPAWDAIMDSDDATAIDELLTKFKNGDTTLTFFADSEIGKKRASAVEAQISERIFKEKQEKKN